MKKRYCPKCYRKPIRYIEKWTDHTIDFDAVDGVPEEEGYLFPGAPYGVEAICECGISGNCEVSHK